VIVAATAIGKRLPSAAGLIGVMPLPIVLIASFGVWLGAAIGQLYLALSARPDRGQG
jgi:hypothetical protein